MLETALGVYMMCGWVTLCTGFLISVVNFNSERIRPPYALLIISAFIWPLTVPSFIIGRIFGN